MRRRTLLAGGLAAPLVLGLTGWRFGVGADLPALTLYDARLPRAASVAQAMELHGGSVRTTGGEIAALLLRERLLSHPGIVLGITGHAEFLLAADIARMSGRSVAPLMQLGQQDRWLGQVEHSSWQPLLGDLLARAPGLTPQATAFAWLVSDADHSLRPA